MVNKEETNTSKEVLSLDDLEITEVQVSLGGTITSPIENYENFRPDFSLKAKPKEGQSVRDVQLVLYQQLEKAYAAVYGKLKRKPNK